MMLTTEQRVALEWAMDVMGDCDAQDAIGDMLSQSVPAWQVTQERIDFLAEIANLMDESGFVAKGAFLRGMLAEVPTVEKYISSEAHK